jgi:hypothetical protein
MKHMMLTSIFLYLTSAVLFADGEIEITGVYQMKVACFDNHFEEIPGVVQAGKDKFSGKFHALELSPSKKQELRIGMKVKVKGKKNPTKTFKMTKGELRRAMAKHIAKKEGLPYQCKKMKEVLAKMIPAKEPSRRSKGARSTDKALELAPSDDDDEIVEVRAMEHVVANTIEIVN